MNQFSTTTRVTRQTKETDVTAAIGDGVRAATGLPFLDHMLTVLGTYAGLGLQVDACGDLPHHVSEDTALTVGKLLRTITPATARRFGEAVVPMDDALVQAVVDCGGRPYFAGRLPMPRYTHWWRSCATAAECTLHLRVLRGHDRHHVVEAAFKAAGLALRAAMADDGVVFSTKGAVRWQVTP